MAHYTGGCHCGGIAYEVDGEIEQVLDCNCSMCGKRGGLLWFVPRAALRPEDAGIELPDLHVQHAQAAAPLLPDLRHFAVHRRRRSPTAARWRVNARCLDGVDLASLKIVPFDGRSRQGLGHVIREPMLSARANVMDRLRGMTVGVSRD